VQMQSRWLLPVQRCFPTLLLVRCFVLLSAQPLEGTWVVNRAPHVGPKQVPMLKICPHGFYRSQRVVWHCNEIQGRRFVHIEPFGNQTALVIPVGLENFTLDIAAVVNADVQLLDVNAGVWIVAHTSRKVEIYRGMDIDFQGYTVDEPNLAHLHISGRVTIPVSVIFLNHADEGGTIDLDYRYSGLRPCPEMPPGCARFEEVTAHKELLAWSSWVRARYPTVEGAWEALAAPKAQSLSRKNIIIRKQFQKAGAVPWYKWEAVWRHWDGATSSKSWQYVFHLLDRDKDQLISHIEFARGYSSSGDSSSGDNSPSSGGGVDRSGSGSGGAGGGIDFSAIGLRILWTLLLLACIAAIAWRSCLNDSSQAKPAPHLYQHLRGQARGPAVVPVAEGQRQANTPTKMASPQNVASDTTAESEWMGPRSCGLNPMLTPLACVGWGRQGKEVCSIGAFTGADPAPNKLESMSGGFSHDRPFEPAEGQDREHLNSKASEAHAVEKAIRDMHREPLNLTLQEMSCALLEELALNVSGKGAISAHSGIEAIIAAMARHPGSAYLQECASGALGNQALRAEECQRTIIAGGGINAVVLGMKEHPQASGLQEKGSWALEQLALTGDGRLQIADSGGIAAIVHAMQVHPLNQQVQEHGCMLLGNMAFETSFRRWICNSGGVRAVVDSMQNHLEDAVIQENACFALHNIACSDSCMLPIVECGGLDAVVQTMQQHPWSASVQEGACNALHNIGCGSKYPWRFARLGGVELVVRALRNHPSSVGLAARGIHVLGQLSAGDDSVRKQLQQLDAVGVIQAARQEHPNDREIQEVGDEVVRLFVTQ